MLPDSIETPNDLQLPERLPDFDHFVINDLIKVSNAKLGLRSTSPRIASKEVQNGVNGDYIVLSDFSHIVHIPEDVLGQFMAHLGYQFGRNKTQDEIFQASLANLSLRGTSNSDLLNIVSQIDISEVPQRYESALHSFILRSAMSALPYQVNDGTSVKQYINEMTDQGTPALLLIKSSHDIGYDYTNYFNLGKRGKGFIAPDQFIAQTGISTQNIALLTKRYEMYLDTSVTKDSGTNSKRLYRRIDEDVSKMLLSNTISNIKKIIQ